MKIFQGKNCRYLADILIIYTQLLQNCCNVALHQYKRSNCQMIQPYSLMY